MPRKVDKWFRSKNDKVKIYSKGRFVDFVALVETRE